MAAIPVFSSAMLVGLACILKASQHRAPHKIIQWAELCVLDLNISEVIFCQNRAQLNNLFTLKTAHLSSNRYNFSMQPNIAMKFAKCVA